MVSHQNPGKAAALKRIKLSSHTIAQLSRQRITRLGPFGDLEIWSQGGDAALRTGAVVACAN